MSYISFNQKDLKSIETYQKEKKMGDYETTDQVGWNIVADQAKHIFGLIKKSTDHYLQGQLGSWFWHLTALRQMINYDLKPDDRTKLDNLEKEAKKYIGDWNKHQKKQKEGLQVINSGETKAKFSAAIINYQCQLMDFLKSLGYFPNKEDRTKMAF